MAKVNLDFCLQAMGLDSLTESKARKDLLDEEHCFFRGVSSDQFSKESHSYILTFREETQDSRDIERNHKLSFELQKDRIVAHYILVEQIRQVFPTLDVLKPVSRCKTCRTDIIAEFMPLEEDELVVYEVGKIKQEMIEDENKRNQGFIRPIASLKEISLDNRNLVMKDFSSSLETNKQKKIHL